MSRINLHNIHIAAAAMLIALLSLSLPSCGSARKAVADTGAVSSIINADTDSMTGRWNTAYMPVRISVLSPSKFALSGRATMVRDSAVYISLRVLGMEVGAVSLTADSLWVVDKYHKFMFAESTRNILGQHYMSMARLQDLMLGADSAIVDGTLSILNSAGEESASISFSDYCSTQFGTYAAQMVLTALLGKTTATMSLQWDLESAKWNDSSTRIKFTPPSSGYKRAGIADAMEVLKSL